MTEPVFVDTNVIVYRFDTKDPRKQSRAGDWFTFLWDRRSGRVSFQAFDDVRVIDPFATPDRTPEEVLESLTS